MTDIKTFNVADAAAVGLRRMGKAKVPRLIFPKGNGQIIDAVTIEQHPESVCIFLQDWLQAWLDCQSDSRTQDDALAEEAERHRLAVQRIKGRP